MQKVNENKPLTIYDIAREAGVSPATVSRVMTNRANVSSDKREKVMELICKYNFQPNVLAKSLADARTKIIGIVAADVRNPFFASMFVACEQAAKELGYTVLLCNSLGVKDLEIELLGKLKEQRVDAIIHMGGCVDDQVPYPKYVEAVRQLPADIPFITTGRLEGVDCHMVQIDEDRGMEVLMKHLIELNHKKIALIGGTREIYATYDKQEKYKQLLQEHGLEVDPDLISDDGTYDYACGYREMQKMLDKKKCPTAVIAVNDYTATGVIRCLVDNGYQIPGDISVVSYDNTSIAESMIPKMTSVDYGYEEFGRKLIQTTVDLLEGKQAERLQKITPTLTVRESSGPAPK